MTHFTHAPHQSFVCYALTPIVNSNVSHIYLYFPKILSESNSTDKIVLCVRLTLIFVAKFYNLNTSYIPGEILTRI